MLIRDSEIVDRLLKAIDTTCKDWEKTQLSEIEIYERKVFIVGGIMRAALFILPTDRYQQFRSEVKDKYFI